MEYSIALSAGPSSVAPNQDLACDVTNNFCWFYVVVQGEVSVMQTNQPK